MANKISMYHVYDDHLEEFLNVSDDTTFYFYDEQGQTQFLKQTVDYEYKTLLSNNDDSWEYGRYGFGLSINLTVGSAASLFGIDSLQNIDAKIGIALQWMSKQSSQRGIVPITTITHDSPNNLTIPITHYFPKELLYGEVVVSIVLYLKTASKTQANGQAQLVGTILGELIEWVIILDGEGSTFPIVIVSEPEKPLWYVDFNYNEPLIEPFDKEFIAIYLNKAHDAFTAIQNPKIAVEQALYVSFLAGALQLIIQNLMQCNDWFDIQNGRNCEEGSIGEVIHYFITTFEWDLDTPEKLAMSLHKDLEKKVKAGVI